MEKRILLNNKRFIKISKYVYSIIQPVNHVICLFNTLKHKRQKSTLYMNFGILYIICVFSVMTFTIPFSY